MVNEVIKEAYIDDVVSLFPAGYVEGALAVFEHIEELPIESYPIKVNAFLMLCCIGGHAELEVNLRRYSFGKGDIMLIQNRQIVQVMSKEDVKCFAFLVSPDFIDKVTPIKEKVMSLLLLVAENPVLSVDETEMSEMKSFYGLLLKWINEDSNPNKKEIIHGLAYSIMFYLGSLVTKYMPVTQHKVTRKEEILKEFLNILADNYYSEKSVSFYADKLFINPKHLTNVIKELTGKTAGEWIDDYVILESKMLLKNTNLTVCQIAQRLNFANQSFFGKYFRQHVGMSPVSYRNSDV